MCLLYNYCRLAVFPTLGTLTNIVFVLNGQMVNLYVHLCVQEKEGVCVCVCVHTYICV